MNNSKRLGQLSDVMTMAGIDAYTTRGPSSVQGDEYCPPITKVTDLREEALPDKAGKAP